MRGLRGGTERGGDLCPGGTVMQRAGDLALAVPLDGDQRRGVLRGTRQRGVLVMFGDPATLGHQQMLTASGSSVPADEPAGRGDRHRGRPAVDTPRHRVDAVLDRPQIRGRVDGEVRALADVTAQQTVPVLIGRALPRRVRLREVDVDARQRREVAVAGHLPALVPRQGAPELLRDPVDQLDQTSQVPALPQRRRAVSPPPLCPCTAHTQQPPRSNYFEVLPSTRAQLAPLPIAPQRLLLHSGERRENVRHAHAHALSCVAVAIHVKKRLRRSGARLRRASCNAPRR